CRGGFGCPHPQVAVDEPGVTGRRIIGQLARVVEGVFVRGALWALRAGDGNEPVDEGDERLFLDIDQVAHDTPSSATKQPRTRQRWMPSPVATRSQAPVRVGWPAQMPWGMVTSTMPTGRPLASIHPSGSPGVVDVM